MSKHECYKVSWDNGMNACDTFANEFDTRDEAEAFGESWASEANAWDKDYHGYTYDVHVAPRSKPIPPPCPEIWTACIQKSIVGPVVVHVRKRTRKHVTDIPQRVAEFLELRPGTRRVAMENGELDSLAPNTTHGYYKAQDGDICKVTRRYNGMRVWVTFKLCR